MTRPAKPSRGRPQHRGLYSTTEHDSCGVGFVVDLKGRPSRDILVTAMGALRNLQHRGALGAEVNTGDGAGLLIQVPDRFFRAVVDAPLPPAGAYATGIAFLPQNPADAEAACKVVEHIVLDEGLRVITWREVPIDPSTLGSGSLQAMPAFRQIFIAGPEAEQPMSGIDLDRRVYMVRKRIEHEIHVGAVDTSSGTMGRATSTHEGVYFPSLSARTLVYKGMLTTPQLATFYPDLADERLETALALVHSRFSTNTFPSWPLAHPYRYIAHNGEINTLRGNRNWLRAREALIKTPLLPGDLRRIYPICTPEASDTASFDECLELLVMGGYSLPEAVLMMIPEPWENHESMSPELTDFYRYHASLMEPWDGPASIAFTDGTTIGAVLDRNGLRPSRYWVTDDDRVIMASEVGVVDVPSCKIIEKGRLQPGRIFFIDTAEGRIVRDPEIKSALAGARPYGRWLAEHQVELDGLPTRSVERADQNSLTQRQQTFGYTHEELRLLVTPMVQNAKEAIGSMGNDAPLAVLSQRPRLLYDYFKQLFAQVTNPPLDAIREEIITATLGWLGPEGNLLDPQPTSCRQILIRHPVLTDEQLAQLIAVDDITSGQPAFRAEVIPCLFPVAEGGAGLRRALEEIRAKASAAIDSGVNVIVLSDRDSSQALAPIPALLATGAVHHHLVREKSRAQAALAIETGEMREVHHLCCLLGYGANAVNPYLVFEIINDLIDNGMYGLDRTMDKRLARRNYIEACDKGVLKVMSKMGISTVKSYVGAQIFEAIGIGAELIDECFTDTTSRLAGVGYDEIAEECIRRHRRAYPDNPLELAHRDLDIGGQYQWRAEGEYHLFNPETVFKLQHATQTGRYDIFKEYTSRIDDQSLQLATLRGLFRFRLGDRPPVPLDEVEPVSSIVTRFTTGAMSYGSISREAHETIAIAMNRIGAKSNTGEGGEDPDRYVPDANGDLRRSAIKQAASGRFGVTSEYLVNADDIQIKMAQGAKPGEGGQLPGHKVWPWIAKTRHSTPGVGLISPPPHHDIYSIEDLAQLIHDLKNANPQARIHVKLVSELGVGTVAAGVAKAHADVVLISGYDGGTGASPLTSIKHAGTPWELGLAETQQTLLLNNLRDRIVVQVDGQMKTGRDVMVAALLGAEEFGFGTAALVVMGCVMMRVCHLDTCPVGVATQNPKLRSKFAGKPDYLVNFMQFVAQEVRELLAQLGFRSLEEAVGHAELLDVADAVEHWKAAGLDLTPILHTPELPDGAVRHQTTLQDHGLDKALDETLIQLCEGAIADGDPVHLELPIRNVNRTVGTMLGNLVTTRWGGDGLPDNTISIDFTGSAGQSFGAFLPRGITMRLIGDANDYLAKGLSGGRIIVLPPQDSPFVAEENIIAGNVILYGATSGEVFLRGVVGERFCVRNSGAVAIVEGVGDHGCEYMTGGRAVILGRTGRNFGAGMSGGIAYVYDSDGSFPAKVNLEMVDLDPMNDEDVAWLRERIEMHLAETGSAVAGRLLANWVEEAALFCKVMPKDYKRVLDAMARAERDGTDPIEAVMEAAHG
jgi:glutamate synthase (NADPH/NADH) large chain